MSKQNILCNNTDINNKMNQLIETAKSIPFSEPYDYLHKVYEKFSYNTDNIFSSNHLQNVECFFIYNIFQEIVKNTNKFRIYNDISLNQIEPNDILFIKCPSIFADYHFIVVAVNATKTEVSIYQSFGQSMQLHQIVLSFNEFINLMKQLDTFGTRNFDTDFMMMKEIESILYGLDVNNYIKSQETIYNYKNSDSDSDVDYISDDDDSICLHAEKLGLSYNYCANLERMYELNKNSGNKVIEINAYRLISSAGGKKRKTKRKQYNKQKTCKRKRKQTYKRTIKK